MPNEPDQRPISRQTILEALAALNCKLDQEGVVGEICIFGGTAMVLAFNARLSTKDVDAIFKPPDIIRRLAAELAESMDLSANWLNDGVKGFVSGAPEYTSDGLPQLSHLRVIRPTADYLLAMKCMAARAPAYDTQGDREDITFLIDRAGLKTAEEVLAIVERFYPPDRILPKTHFMLLEVFENISKRSSRPESVSSGESNDARGDE
jgi:hypothetical protein